MFLATTPLQAFSGGLDMWAESVALATARQAIERMK